MLLEFAAMETSDSDVTLDTAASDTEQHGEDAPPVPSDVSEPEAHSADPIPPEPEPEPPIVGAVDNSGNVVHEHDDGTIHAHDPVVVEDSSTSGTSFTVSVSDHAVDVSVEDAPDDEPLTSIEGLSVDDLNRLSHVIAEEKSKRGQVAPRPFENVDTESLLVLQNQLRGELASR